MGARTAPSSPSATADDSRPVSTSTGRCCWCEDYTKEVVVSNTTGYYSRRYHEGGGEYNPSGPYPRKFKLIVPLRGSTVTVEIRFKFVQPSRPTRPLRDGSPDPAEPGTPEQMEDGKARLLQGVPSHWNGKLMLEIDDLECGKKQFAIEYKPIVVSSGEHYTVHVWKTVLPQGQRAHVAGHEMHTSDESTIPWVYAHEFGHCTGLPDEYGYTGEDGETVRYIKPDGSLDAAVPAPSTPRSPSAPGVTIMGAHGATRVVERHGYNIAIEVQKLLSEKLGRRIRCTVIET